ncbi:MAG: HAMP domain-containing sensor histidine kinase [Lachnospiraceae bacterium]|nr:HAMP domain-containing sensor histidine kinase [Lachnospiraceae bacterium]
MSRNDMWYVVAAVVSTLAVLTALGSFLYYRGQIRRMFRMLRRYQGQEYAQETLADTRESKLEAQLRKLLRQSALQQEQAKKDKENLAGLLSDLSHQLKTPLANVMMDAELLQDETLSNEERRGFSKHIAEQAEKMQWLLSALIKASRLETGILHFEAKQQGIRQTLAQSVSAVYVQAQEKEISIVTQEFTDRELYHNRKWTAEAITNILENAVKYSPEGSCIQIDVQPLEIYTRINIRDQGPGVKPEEYNKIFQRFYRGSAMSEAEGTGLGLYLAQTILAQEKGYITAAANQEGGSCFSVFLLNESNI